jgi:hypothetical protein
MTINSTVKISVLTQYPFSLVNYIPFYSIFCYWGMKVIVRRFPKDLGVKEMMLILKFNSLWTELYRLMHWPVQPCLFGVPTYIMEELCPSETWLVSPSSREQGGSWRPTWQCLGKPIPWIWSSTGVLSARLR